MTELPLSERYGREPEKAGWRPISTAPRDGRKILLGHSQSAPGYACEGAWLGEPGGWAMRNYFVTRDRRLLTQPDQWRDLPTPPHGEEG